MLAIWKSLFCIWKEEKYPKLYKNVSFLLLSSSASIVHSKLFIKYQQDSKIRNLKFQNLY